MYKVLLTKRAGKGLTKIAKPDSKRIVERFQKLSYPFPTNFDIAKIAGKKGYFRLRVGNTRTIFEVDEIKNQIILRRIDYRGRIYKGI